MYPRLPFTQSLFRSSACEDRQGKFPPIRAWSRSNAERRKIHRQDGCREIRNRPSGHITISAHGGEQVVQLTLGRGRGSLHIGAIDDDILEHTLNDALAGDQAGLGPGPYSIPMAVPSPTALLITSLAWENFCTVGSERNVGSSAISFRAGSIPTGTDSRKGT